MINPHQFCTLILEPTIIALDMYSVDAMYLMSRTLVVESKLTHLKQIPSGIALGLGQIEPATIADVYRYLDRRKDIKQKVLDYTQYCKLPTRMDAIMHNLSLNVALARIKYWMNPEPLPHYKNVSGQAEYWKQYYNTENGQGKVSDFIKHADTVQGWFTHETKEDSSRID